MYHGSGTTRRSPKTLKTLTTQGTLSNLNMNYIVVTPTISFLEEGAKLLPVGEADQLVVVRHVYNRERESGVGKGGNEVNREGTGGMG